MRTAEVTSPTCFLLARSQLLWEGRKANAVPIPRMTLGLPEGSAPSLVWGVAAWPWVRLLTPHGFMAPLTHPLGWGGAGLPKGGCIRRLLLSGLPGTKPALLCPEAARQSENRKALEARLRWITEVFWDPLRKGNKKPHCVIHVGGANGGPQASGETPALI